MVLYLHGWADYLFQVELADFFELTLAQTAGRGCDFFALDLRKYGRSLPEGYKYPNFAEDLDEYFPEITEALDETRRDGYPWVLLNGPSTRALVAARCLQDGPRKDDVKALFLNSPFLDFTGLQIAPAHISLTRPLDAVAGRLPPCGSGARRRGHHTRRPKLGMRVTLRPITGGVHDLVLSDAGVRSRVLDEVTAWLRSIWPPPLTANRTTDT